MNWIKFDCREVGEPVEAAPFYREDGSQFRDGTKVRRSEVWYVCTRCRAEMQIHFPIMAKDWIEQAEAFRQQHQGCPPPWRK